MIPVLVQVTVPLEFVLPGIHCVASIGRTTVREGGGRMVNVEVLDLVTDKVLASLTLTVNTLSPTFRPAAGITH